MRETGMGSGCGRISLILEPSLDVGQGNTERCPRDPIQSRFWPAQMHRAMDVREALARGQSGRRGRGFQLEEWTHWLGARRGRSVVVTVGRITAVGIVLQLPERIDVVTDIAG